MPVIRGGAALADGVGETGAIGSGGVCRPQWFRFGRSGSGGTRLLERRRLMQCGDCCCRVGHGDRDGALAQGAVSVTKQKYGGAGSILRVKVVGAGEVTSSGVGAVSLNVTVANPVAAGFVTVFPCGDRPTSREPHRQSVPKARSIRSPRCAAPDANTHVNTHSTWWRPGHSTRGNHPHSGRSGMPASSLWELGSWDAVPGPMRLRLRLTRSSFCTGGSDQAICADRVFARSTDLGGMAVRVSRDARRQVCVGR
jgi:hypothetical protein